MNNYALIRQRELGIVPTTRLPICLCLDTSGSMSGEPIRELNAGVRQFYDAIREDDLALYSCEICIVTFGNNGVECLSDFMRVEFLESVPVLTADGMTPMGEAVNMGLDLLEKRKQDYKNFGTDYYQPWLVLMTDGEPNGSSSELSRAIDRTTELANRKKLSLFPIGIGRNADMKVLSRFSPKRKPLKLQGLKFRNFFEWLSQSVSRTSQSRPGEDVPLDIDGIKGWAEL